MDRVVASAISALELPTFAVDPDSVYATIHEDSTGKARLLFLINPEPEETVARITVGPGPESARDLLKAQRFSIQNGALEAPVRGKSVRMLALE